jgi:hypothetical protein
MDKVRNCEGYLRRITVEANLTPPTNSSHRKSKFDREPTVKWSGIQNALEESQSDVLVLLDCCAAGLSNTNEGETNPSLCSIRLMVLIRQWSY